MRRVWILCVFFVMTAGAAWAATSVAPRLVKTSVALGQVRRHARAGRPDASRRDSVLFGDKAVESGAGRDSSGSVKAFRFADRKTGTALSISVYVGPRSRAKTLVVGIFTAKAGGPGRLLASGSLSRPRPGAWNTVIIKSVAVKAGRAYWVAVLAKGGTLYFRERRNGSCSSESYAKVHFNALRSSARLSSLKGRHSHTCPISAYVSGKLSASGHSAPSSGGHPNTVTTPPPSSPVNTGLPVISGIEQQGDTLTTTNGNWSNSPTSYSYQWQDCSASCTNITGATGSSYVLQASDVGDTVDVVVTATNAGGSTPATSDQTATVQTPPAPANTAPPTISGIAEPGQTLTASTGSWSNNPTSYGYQWQDCSSSSCSDIGGATKPSYTLPSSYVGKTIDVVVTATNAGGSTPATSDQTATVQTPPAPANTAPPAITGTAELGDTLTASTGSWSNNPTSYGYQWQDCPPSTSCSNISGATESSYVLQASDVGDAIDVVVKATNAGGSTPATSDQTATVQTPPAPANTAPPAITGTAELGDTLTASTGSWSNNPTSYGYQWQDCPPSTSCSNISGATESSYVLQASDVGDAIDVVVKATNAGGSTPATSDQTATVQTPPAPANTAPPAITGTAELGDTLTASTGSWSNNPTSYGYQWQDCPPSTSCSNISGATESSYVLQASDVGDAIDVVVKATNAGGSTPATSDQTATVTSPPPSAPANTGLPVITGNPQQGDALSTTNGTWSGGPTSYGYQWQDCVGATCSNIAGATSSTYTVQSSDVGSSLAVVVTATNPLGSVSASSFNTAAALSGNNSSGLASLAYLLGFSPPSGCSSLNATCITTTNPPNRNAITQMLVFALLGEDPANDATTNASVSGTISSIQVASVTTAIPAGPIMLATTASDPSNYQILQTTGAAVCSSSCSVPVTGSPTANYSYPSGSVVMVQGLNSSKNSIPTGSTLTALTAAIHAAGAKALISIGGSNDNFWTSDCTDGYQYLLGATLAHYIVANNFDGVELDTEQGNTSTWGACWSGAAEEIHSVATSLGNVPIVDADFNQSDTGPSVPAAAKTQVDEFTFFYYGYEPANNYNCANSCSRLAGYLSAVTGSPYDIPAARWVAGQGVAGAGGSAQQTATVLATTTAAVSGAVTSIPVTALAASMPAGTFVLATDDGPPPTSDMILETSGAAEGATSIPVTGYCSPAGWTTGSGNCVNGSPITLNASYASGADIYLDLTGYPTGAYNAGGWDCGNNAAYAAAHGMMGVMEWYDDGSGNTKLCFDQIQPFVSGGFG